MWEPTCKPKCMSSSRRSTCSRVWVCVRMHVHGFTLLSSWLKGTSDISTDAGTLSGDNGTRWPSQPHLSSLCVLYERAWDGKLCSPECSVG